MPVHRDRTGPHRRRSQPRGTESAGRRRGPRTRRRRHEGRAGGSRGGRVDRLGGSIRRGDGGRRVHRRDARPRSSPPQGEIDMVKTGREPTLHRDVAERVSRCVSTMVYYQSDGWTWSGAELVTEEADDLLRWAAAMGLTDGLDDSVLGPLKDELIVRMARSSASVFTRNSSAPWAGRPAPGPAPDVARGDRGSGTDAAAPGRQWAFRGPVFEPSVLVVGDRRGLRSRGHRHGRIRPFSARPESLHRARHGPTRRSKLAGESAGSGPSAARRCGLAGGRRVGPRSETPGGCRPEEM